MHMRKISGNVTAPCGFRAAGMHCGIKRERKDLALIVSDSVCNAAALFTTNRVKAAPVLVDRRKLVASRGKAQAIIVNSGNANACTGKLGVKNAERIAEKTAKGLGISPRLVLVSSTGIIGKQLPMDIIEKGIGEITKKAKPGNSDAAEAIMTTDTRKKEIAVEVEMGGKRVRIGAIAKGVGMINPNVATMLCFITTDANISQKALQNALRDAAAASFNSITVDGDMSTNDSAIVLANGKAGNRVIASAGGADYAIFSGALEYVCTTLAKAIVLDGEGATKFITIRVKGAKSDEDAKLIAKSVANSALFKTAMFGCNPNWGRVICAVGYAKAKKEFDAVAARLKFNGTLVYEGKTGPTGRKVSLARKEILVEIDLGAGKGEATVYTCDFSYDYVKINAEYN